MVPLELTDILTEIVKLQADVIYKQAEALEQAKIAESLAEDLRDERVIIEELCKRAGNIDGVSAASDGAFGCGGPYRYESKCARLCYRPISS